MEGTEEDQVCNRDGCTGVIEFQKAENCSCHISPPCGSCLEVKQHCPECGWVEGDE